MDNIALYSTLLQYAELSTNILKIRTFPSNNRDIFIRELIVYMHVNPNVIVELFDEANQLFDDVQNLYPKLYPKETANISKN